MLITISAPPHVRDLSLVVALKLCHKLLDTTWYNCILDHKNPETVFNKAYLVASQASKDDSKYVILTPALSYVSKVINRRHHLKESIRPSHYLRSLDARNEFNRDDVNIVLTTVKQPEGDDLWEWVECNHYAADVGAEVIYTDTLTTDQIVNQIILQILPQHEH